MSITRSVFRLLYCSVSSSLCTRASVLELTVPPMPAISPEPLAENRWMRSSDEKVRIRS